jgi:hypothetical protein
MSASAILSIIAPQFDSTAGRDNYLAYAELQVTEDFFGDKYDLAIGYMAAHLLTIDTNVALIGLSTGGITNKREGDLSVTFSNTKEKGTDSILGQTSYGRQFLQLRNSCGPFIGVSSGNSNSFTWPTPPGGNDNVY